MKMDIGQLLFYFGGSLALLAVSALYFWGGLDYIERHQEPADIEESE